MSREIRIFTTYCSHPRHDTPGVGIRIGTSVVDRGRLDPAELSRLFPGEAPLPDGTPADELRHLLVALHRGSEAAPGSIELSRSGDDILLWFSSEDPRVGTQQALVAIQLREQLLVEQSSDGRARLARTAHERARNAPTLAGLTFTQRRLARAARDQGKHVQALGGGRLQIGEGCHRRVLLWHMTDVTTHLGVIDSTDKVLSSRVLQEAGLPVPRQGLAASPAQALRVARRLGFPVVVKPARTDKGAGVAVDLRTEPEVERAFTGARRFAGPVLVQEMLPGSPHRFTLVGERLVGVERMHPASVVGDGVSRIRGLIDAVNQDPRRGDGISTALRTLELDDEAHQLLAREGLNAESVPAAGARILLRTMGNVCRGGTAEYVLSAAHPENQQLARDAAKLMGAEIAGVDIMLPDVRRSWRETGGSILEVNVNPGLNFDQARRSEDSVLPDVPGALLELLFPRGRPHRIPRAVFPGAAPGNPAAKRLVELLSRSGTRTGWAGFQGMSFEGSLPETGDRATPEHAMRLARDPRLQALVLEVSAARVARRGAGFERCSVLVVPSSPPASEAGAEGLEHLVQRADHVIVRRSRQGWPDAAQRVAASAMTLVTQNQADPLLRAHRNAGGRALLHDTAEGSVRVRFVEGARVVGVLRLARLPGRIAHPLEALAAAWAMGIPAARLASLVTPVTRTAAVPK